MQYTYTSQTNFQIKKTTKIITGIIILLMGLFMGLIAIIFYSDNKNNSEKCTKTTTGVIVEIICSNKKGHDTRRTVYYPIVEYTVGTQTYTHKVTNPGRKNLFKIGDMMDVHYNPSDPGDVYVDREAKGNSIGYKVISVCAAFNIIGSIFIFVFPGRKRKNS